MRITNRVRYFIPALLLGVLAFTSSDIKAAINKGNALHLAARLAADHCGGDCHTCGQQIHKTHLISGGSGSHWDFPYGCVEAPCPNECSHGGQLPGGGNDEPLEEVLTAAADAIQRDDVSAVRAILATEKRLFVNHTRGVLQATGCHDDKIVATIGLSEVMLASVGIGTE